MLHEFSRTELLIGGDALKKLAQSRVAVFGIGGVGTYAVEGLARCGVGRLVLVDDDCICLTNINRQLHATRKTIGMPKCEAMRDRILEINPKCEVAMVQKFYLPATAEEILNEIGHCDYIIDAIDTVTGKIDLIVRAKEREIPVISCMGTGNKMDPSRFEVTDIYSTQNCPLAKVMRKELKLRCVESLKVVYSREPAMTPMESEATSCAIGCVCPPGTTRHCTERRQIPGSISFVPAVAGMITAGEVIKDIINWKTLRKKLTQL